MPITAREKLGIEDLLVTNVQNIPTLQLLARSVTKNVCDIESTQEALDYLYTVVGDTQILLNKRHITKDLLFKYLILKKIPINNDFTKGTLITKVIEHWNNSEATLERIHTSNDAVTANSEASYTNNATRQQCEETLNESAYPIHLLARKFSEWFFDNYNEGNLKTDDFWADARLQLQIAADDRLDNQHCDSSEAVIQSLMHSKHHFGFYFNPNLTHAGVQGRMDVHGLVLVLVCGTLHTQQNCVGVFECNFGLLRDPFAENNWKVKTIQCVLRSQNAAHTPRLQDSDTLKSALELPVPKGGDFS